MTFPLPLSTSASEEDLSVILGQPETGQVRRIHGGDQLEPGMPSYIVRPSSYPSIIKRSLPTSVKVIDYGQSFLDVNDVPATLNTPLAVRAPEIVLGDSFDHCVDLWSMGCLVGSLCFYQAC